VDETATLGVDETAILGVDETVALGVDETVAFGVETISFGADDGVTLGVEPMASLIGVETSIGIVEEITEAIFGVEIPLGMKVSLAAEGVDFGVTGTTLGVAVETWRVSLGVDGTSLTAPLGVTATSLGVMDLGVVEGRDLGVANRGVACCGLTGVEDKEEEEEEEEGVAGWHCGTTFSLLTALTGWPLDFGVDVALLGFAGDAGTFALGAK
jgi:hypothetical protein